MTSRREFLTIAAAAILATSVTWAAEELPSMLDHIMLACNDLDHGITIVEEHLGVHAAYGGVHPGRGTRNALLALGETRYLEIIAPDPAQKNLEAWAAKQIKSMKALANPRIIGWAARTNDIEGIAERLRESGIKFYGPRAGSRARPDGRTLNWKTLALEDDRVGLLPFFIQWGADTVHPSKDAPPGCRLEHFAVVGPDVAELSKSLRTMGVDSPVEHADKPQLRARIDGLGKKYEASSI
jgi:hypothetical protein